ncbi:hypothetical protein CDAR_610391 [Caerostris darwini]|uniref:F-box domain-containing protein n=1 Tax=Caerostris darwini TaxID=1538125 RepID=A0AAV4N6C9_9ARAC|nr:hypothetical protein CDAR_610391 [Caerostris darwini]
MSAVSEQPKKKRRVGPQQNVEESNSIPIQTPLARPRGLTGVFCVHEDCRVHHCRLRDCSASVPNLASNDFQISVPNLESSNDIPGPSGYVSHGKSCGNEFADIPHKATSSQTSLKEPSLLLNDKDMDDDGDGYMYFQTLPPHIIELILLQLPFIDLMKCTLVCKTWYELITAENFMEWKKRYYRLKKDSDKGALYMDWISTQLSIDTVENCFGGLIKYFSQYYKKETTQIMHDLLMKNPKSVAAEKVISERFPEFLKNESKAWCIFATTILLSETVEDVYNFYQLLMSAKSDCPRQDITNAMYCVASFLFHFKVNFGINYGLHYRVYSALFWIENEPFTKEIEDFQPLKISKKLLGQQSIHSYGLDSKILLTNEQQRILNHKLQPGDIVKINGLAGTGKTTTLIHLAQLYPQMKFLHITFNEDICEEAEKLFPPNVSCKTVYSVADGEGGEILNSQLISKLEPQDLVPGLEHESESDLPLLIYAKFVLVTIENFVSSADTRILINHVPSKVGSINSILGPEKLILKDANKIWRKLTDRDSESLKITRNMYLKLYHLGKPKILGFDCIMVDDAQDCHPALLDIVTSQNLPIILIGDPNQHIYGFCGSINALRTVRSTHTYSLTKSFRFGPKIAYIASCCLEVLNSNIFTTLVGNKKPSCIEGKVIGQYAIFARTYVHLFNEAYRLCVEKRFKSFEPQTIQGCFAGGFENYAFDQIIEISKMAQRQHDEELPEIHDEFLSQFNSFEDLTSYAKNIGDTDLLTMIELVNQHGSNIENYIQIIQEQCSYNMDLANVVFTTIYDSKGFQFDTVCLSEDFFITVDIDFNKRGRFRFEENSILYAIVTSAKESVILSEKLLLTCLGAQEKFEYPVLTSTFYNGKDPVHCIKCSAEFEPHTTLTLVQRELTAASGEVIKGGPLCIRCAIKPKFRPRLYIDPLHDYAHRSMVSLVGPLPRDPPVDPDPEPVNAEVFYVVYI